MNDLHDLVVHNGRRYRLSALARAMRNDSREIVHDTMLPGATAQSFWDEFRGRFPNEAVVVANATPPIESVTVAGCEFRLAPEVCGRTDDALRFLASLRPEEVQAFASLLAGADEVGLGPAKDYAEERGWPRHVASTLAHGLA